MIILTEDIKKICNKILFAIDSQNSSQITESLEMYTNSNYLYMCVTNREYFVKVKLNVYDSYDFHATISADTFLKLISKTTSNNVELECTDKCLIVKADGKYKIPLIYDINGNLLTLPTINIDQQSMNFDISGDIISSIPKYRYKFNNKQLKKMYSNTVQDMYYIDENGCLTFTSGACINTFTLSQPCKFLLTDKIVKLFKLFNNESVNFTLGHRQIQDIVLTVVKFKDDDVELTATLNDSNLINSVPAAIIRRRATNTYDHNIIVNKNYISQAIDRLMIFDPEIAGHFKFGFNSVEVYNKLNTNSEVIYYINEDESLKDQLYTANLDLVDLKAVLDTISDEFINISFGDHQAFVLIKDNITYVIPEVIE